MGDSPGGSGLSRILLLLDQKENAQLLAEEIGDRHHVALAQSVDDLEQSCDLLVVDGRALDRTWELVRARRRAELPLYLPVLLVTSRPTVKMITRQVWRSIDELIITPIEKPELRARVEVLLRVRAQSLELRTRALSAEQALSSRDEVVQMVSHDLRNPLNVVLSYTSLLLETGADTLAPRQLDHLRAIYRAVHQMSRLTQDLLEMARLEAGAVPIAPAPAEPAELVRTACEQHRLAAEGRGVNLTCDLHGELPVLQLDRDRIDQLLGNLIANALRFSPPGGRVEVSAAPTAGGVRFAVNDQGPGLSEDDARRVFDRFWRGSTEPGAAGLGLAIARGIAEAHGGRIGVTSTPGKGAEFWFVIPSSGD